jgi:hypothetical protein
MAAGHPRCAPTRTHAGGVGVALRAARAPGLAQQPRVQARLGVAALGGHAPPLQRGAVAAEYAQPPERSAKPGEARAGRGRGRQRQRQQQRRALPRLVPRRPPTLAAAKAATSSVAASSVAAELAVAA